jgi:hypothetical protein
MTRFALSPVLLAAMLVLSLPVQAAGSLTRSFVSSAGNDSNPCTITQPCATFAVAYAATAANGVIAALDPGKYGPLTITGPVTINGNGWAAITAPASGNGITITAGASDNVALIGLEIDGAGAGYNGIVLNVAGSLTVTDCVVQNFTTGSGISGNGITIATTSGTVSFVIRDSTFSNNATDGILYIPQSQSSATVSGVIDHVTATGNGDAGIQLFASNMTRASLVATISRSVASNNDSGIIVVVEFNATATIEVSIDNTTVSGNGTGSGLNSTGGGIVADGPARVLLGRSVITGNSNGIDNQTFPNTFYTYQDNRIDLNGVDILLDGIGSPLNTTFAPQ